MQKCFTFDQNRCTGCHACQLACEIENRDSQSLVWREVSTFNISRASRLPVFHYSLACNHCADPACMKNCPALAYSKDAETGAVGIDPEKCIGCRYCTWVCPYDAPKYNQRTGVVEKCTFCAERLGLGGIPACAEYCPTGALGFAEITEDELENTIDLPGFPETGNKPAIKIKKIRIKNRIPDMSEEKEAMNTSETLRNQHLARKRKVTAGTEKSLIAFTFIAAVLTAYFTAGYLTPFIVPAVPFTGAGIAALLLSALHLGNKKNIFRALLNIRHSWVSREVASFSLFILFAGLHLFLFPRSSLLAWIAVAAGTFALFAMDRVYMIRTNEHFTDIHSGMAMLTGFFLLSVFTGSTLFILIYGLTKLIYYCKRKIRFHKNGINTRLFLSTLRLEIGFLFPFILWQVDGSTILILISIGIGELIDRAELYMELDILTPEKQITADQLLYRS